MLILLRVLSLRKPSHIKEIRNFIQEHKETSPSLIAKIETMEAIENFPRYM